MTRPLCSATWRGREGAHEWLRTGRFARREGLALSTVHDWIRTGRLHAVQLGGPGSHYLIHLPCYLARFSA